MTIFHEIYSSYFRIASEILKLPVITEKNINRIINEHGFRDTMLFLPQKFISRNGWGLLKNTGEKFIPVIKNKPVSVLTEIQKQWIRAKLDDPKINLFLESSTVSALKERLKNVKPLYRNEHFRYTDRFIDGDDFSDVNYQKNFRTVLSAVKTHEILEITFNSKNNQKLRGFYIPLKIQYSPKNDRFRLLAFRMHENEVSGSATINIGRITEINRTGKVWEADISMEDYFSQQKCREPVTVIISEERNAVQRFFMEFAPFEKRAEFDLSSGKCTVEIWYDRQDETELLIRLLSFGPVIEVTAPHEFRRKLQERVTRQYDLLHKKTLI